VPAGSGAGAARSTQRPPSAGDADVAALAAGWEAVMAAVARDDKNLAALLKDGKPVAADARTVTIGFFYPFHSRRVAEAPRADRVRRAIAEVTGVDRELECVIIDATDDERRARPVSKEGQAENDPVIRHAVDELGARIAAVRSDDVPK
jgi:hypothetical protein